VADSSEVISLMRHAAARPTIVVAAPGCEIINPRALADVRFGAHYGLKSDIAPRPFRAMAQSRCAPARCAGARTERLVADGEDSDSGVASINSRIVGVQRMIKNSRIICGQHPFTANHVDPAYNVNTKNWLDE
jgi:hypothetical protein